MPPVPIHRRIGMTIVPTLATAAMLVGASAAHGDANLNFESPALGSAARAVVNPYSSGGVSFTAMGGSFSDAVVGVVKNSATSACVDPAGANQKLGTGRSAFTNGSIGLSGFPIKGKFGSPLAPASGGQVQIGAEFQTLAGTTLRIRLYNASGAQVGIATKTAGPAGGTCGYPGGQRARTTVTASATAPVASVVMDTVEGGRVFVIDTFRAVTVAPPSSACAGENTPINAGNVAAAEQSIVCLVNKERAKANPPLAPLTVDSRLRGSARAHSADMVAHHFFEHVNQQGKSPCDRIVAAGYPAQCIWSSQYNQNLCWTGRCGENIAWNSGSATPWKFMYDPQSGWMTHPGPDGTVNTNGHRKAILTANFKHIGVGVVTGTHNGSTGATATQNFGSPS